MTAFTDEVREIVSPHKFGGSRRAAACYLLSLDSCFDEASGDVDSPTGWFARYGRTLQYCDSLGFVDCEKFATEDAARAWFSVLEQRYADWDDSDA